MLNSLKRQYRKATAAIRGIRYRDQPEKIVAKGYDKMADSYGSWALRHERADREKYTSLLLETLPANSELLELGCGPGDPTTKTLSQHYRVTANDISESCLNLARKNAPKAQFVLSDMTQLEFPANSFDAAVAYYAFHHIPRDRYHALIRNIHSWVRPGGYFMAAFYPYDVENLVTEDWHGSPMYWSSFDADATIAMVKETGFEILTQSKESAIEDGRETTFLWMLARSSQA